MTVFVLERVTPGTRGMLTRWMLEVHPGVFIGTLSARVRDKLWEQLVEKRRGAKKVPALLMAYRFPGEQGFKLVTAGEGSRTVFDFDGLALLGRAGASKAGSRRGRKPAAAP